MKITAAGISHTGLIREKNEDNLYFFDRFLEEDHEGTESVFEYSGTTGDKPLLFGVFDGMGGYAKGERASFLTAQLAGRYAKICRNQPSGTDMEVIGDCLRDLCYEANRLVCREMEENREKMGTTASMLCFSGKEAALCNIGDSPVFLLRDGVLEEISEEHTQRAMYEKLLGKEHVGTRKFPLTQCIGIPEREMRIRPYLSIDEVRSGDRFLICSDGLTDMVDTEDIRELLLGDLSRKALLEKLVEEALDQGGRDNITILLIDLSA